MPAARGERTRGGGDFVREFAAMASQCEIRIAGLPPARARAAADAAIDEVRRIEARYSRYREDSIVSAINRGAGLAPVACDDETLQLLDYADALYRASDGLFDVTSGVLRRAWDFRRAIVPSQAQLDAVLPLVGWPMVERDGATVRLAQAGMEIDFGGFGKEYAADRAAACLLERGARHGFVNLGGDLRALGPQPDGSPWWIGIADPRLPGATIASLPLLAGGLATSGDYERFFERDGLRYCHILDPRNGQPVRHWRSVSVAAPLAVAAGSFATIAMLRGETAPDWLDANGIAWLAVGPDGAMRWRDLPAPG